MFFVAIVTCCISWMSSAKIWSEFTPSFGWMEACFKFFGYSSWRLIVFLLDLVLNVFLAWWLWLFKISSCCWFFVSVWFCCLIWFCCFAVLEATEYVLLVLYWLLLLLFSYWFGWLNFTGEFQVWFSGICLPYLSRRYLSVFFLLSNWI